MRLRPPTPVWIAVAALGVVIALQAVLAFYYPQVGSLGWWRFGFAIVLFGVLLAGLLRGVRLAWLWGRYLTLVLGVVIVASLAGRLWQHALPWKTAALAFAGMAAPLFAVSIALGRPTALAFFELVCPNCGHPSSFGADFLFRKARCRRCQNVW